MSNFLKVVNFGCDSTNLANVGYQLVSKDGSIKQSRTTTGVYEIKPFTGIYGCEIFFDDDWQGIILWDTGESNPIYASEEYYPTDEYVGNIRNDSTTILDNVINIDETLLSLSNDIKRLLGLTHENIFIDLPIFDDDNNLISARIRIYSDSSSVGTTSNVIGTYLISVSGDGPGKFSTWQQVLL